MSWRLSDLSRHPKRDVHAVEREARRVARLFKRFPEHGTGEEAVRVLDAFDMVSRQVHRLSAYASLRLSEDASDEEARALQARLERVERMLATAFDRLQEWIRTVDDAALKPLLQSRFATRVRHVRMLRKHLLPLEVEQALSITSRASEAEILDALQAHQTVFFLDGEKPLSQVQPYVHHPDPAIREAAYKALLKGRLARADTLRVIMHEHVLRVHAQRVELRKYATVREASLVSEGISEEAYQDLLESIREAFPLFDRALRAKHALLSQEKPYAYSRYHVYATHPVLGRRAYTFDEALRIVRGVFERVGLWSLASRVMEEGHASLEPRRGKYAGAFCADVPSTTPYLLMNFTGTLRDVLTLAHELGHCVHDLLIPKDVPVLERHPRLSVAELASTSMEGFVLHALQREAVGEERIALLLLEVDEWYATVLRQGVFSMVEDWLYDTLPRGGLMSSISRAYEGVYAKAFPGMKDVDAFREEWLAIPHLYHHPYYVFTYAWTFLASRLIIQKLEDEGFREGFARVLGQGWRVGGEEALRVLFRTRPRVVFQRAFKQFERLVKQLEREAARKA